MPMLSFPSAAESANVDDLGSHERSGIELENLCRLIGQFPKSLSRQLPEVIATVAIYAFGVCQIYAQDQ